MTLDDRDRARLLDWLDEEATSDGAATYLDDVLATTARTPQLPAWQRTWRASVARAGDLARRQPRLAWPAVATIAIAVLLAVGALWRAPGIGEGLIAYSTGEGIFVVRADGSGTRRVADGARLYRTPWSPDGDQLLVRMEGGGLGAIDVHGDAAVDLLPGDGLDVRAVTWSPDGSRIAFSATDAGTAGRPAQLYSVDPDGTDLHPFIATGSVDGERTAIDGDDPAWSPDGRWLAYIDRTSGLWVLRPDGSERRQLGVAVAADGSVIGGYAWAPDSTRLTYQRRASDARGVASTGIFIIGVDGAAERHIAADAQVEVTPRWSPDGRQIAWLAATTEVFGVTLFDVGSDRSVELRSDVALHRGWLDWSPDGTSLAAYTAARDELALISIDRSSPDAYLSITARITGVAWQP
jgi:Tol biopolymer transport system component